MKKSGILIANLAFFSICIIFLMNAGSIESMLATGALMVLQSVVLLIVAIVAYAKDNGKGPIYLTTLMIIILVGWPGCFFAGLLGMKS